LKLLKNLYQEHLANIRKIQ